MDAQSEEEQRLRTAAALASALYGLVSLGWLVWMLIPEHRKRLLGMKAAAAGRSLAGRAAFRTGHQAMGLELKGCGESGSGYAPVYLLSLARERAGRAYERMRYS